MSFSPGTYTPGIIVIFFQFVLLPALHTSHSTSHVAVLWVACIETSLQEAFICYLQAKKTRRKQDKLKTDSMGKHQATDKIKKNQPYTTFILMLLVSFLAMYITMYLNTYIIGHVYFSLTRFYMACLGISTMAVIMLVFMQNMYSNKKKNMAIGVGSLIVFVSALTLARTQTSVNDLLYLKAMIPHHSIAILTSKRAAIQDPQVRKLANEIIKAQEEEITTMKAYIKRLEQEK